MLESLYKLRQLIRTGKLKGSIDDINRRIDVAHWCLDDAYHITYSPAFGDTHAS